MLTIAKILFFVQLVARNVVVLALDPQMEKQLRGHVVNGPDPSKVQSLSGDSRLAVLFLKSPPGQAFGIALGMAMIGFAARSITRTKLEKKRIQSMYDANTSVEELQKMADAGKDLPSLVIIRGVVSADGTNVPVAAPAIAGLAGNVGQINQPEDTFIQIARVAKAGGMKPLTDKVEQQTGIKASDIPDVPDDFTHRQAEYKGNAILSEMLVARLCPLVTKTKDDNDKITVRRTARKQSYYCFYARNVADGFHLLDMSGARIELKLPGAMVLPQFSPIHHGEAPPFFLPTANVGEEFSAFLRKEGLTVQGKHIDFSNMPQTKVTDPDTLLSKFIFIDAQSTTELGMMNGDSQIFNSICKSYGVTKMLWEPLGFYDADGGRLPSWAQDTTSQMVTPDELLEKAQTAARVNSAETTFCGPTFQREQLLGRRDQESCFRYTELAIPRGSDVTVLASPKKNTQGKVELIPPNSAEDGADVDNPDAQRFRFRLLKGHTVDNLLKQRDVNIMKYYGYAVMGAFLMAWAAADYPGLYAD